jgi:hypothetical protein
MRMVKGEKITLKEAGNLTKCWCKNWCDSRVKMGDFPLSSRRYRDDLQSPQYKKHCDKNK